jgi:hypothetical protein
MPPVLITAERREENEYFKLKSFQKSGQIAPIL